MDIQKQEGPVSIEVVSNNGALSLKASLSQSLGGGQASGVLKASAALEIDLGAQQAADLAMDMLSKQFPSISAAIGGLKILVDAELAKI